MATLGYWQIYVTKWAIRKGFTWTKDEIDTMLLRINSEVSEASEAARDNNTLGLSEELADIFIRLVNTAEVMGVDLETEVEKKMAKNEKRPYRHGRSRK